MTNKEYADSLRMIADFYEQHPQAGLPFDHVIFVDICTGRVEGIINALGSFRNEYDKDFEGSIAFVTKFGEIEFRAITSRRDCCKRKQVGVRQVPEKVIPEMVIPAREEPIYEWDCSEPLLEKEAK